MGVSVEVLSPTFNIVQIYEPEIGPEIWHMDFYRLLENQNPYDLDLQEAFSNSICLIEWPEKFEKFIPSERIQIKIEFTKLDQDKRNIEIVSSSEKINSLLKNINLI